jgi:NAD-dependent SIR2 family protein deacetylase
MKFGMLRGEKLEKLIEIKAEIKSVECIQCGFLTKSTTKRFFKVVYTSSACKKGTTFGQTPFFSILKFR